MNFIILNLFPNMLYVKYTPGSSLLPWLHSRELKPTPKYTPISVTGSGHIKYKKRRLSYKIKDKASCQSNLISYMAPGHILYKEKSWNDKEM